MTPRTTTLFMAAIVIIVSLVVTPWALVGLLLPLAYWFMYGRRDDA